eukprot:scaffold31536_cov140-Isochrysis_galbana.AAC.1
MCRAFTCSTIHVHVAGRDSDTEAQTRANAYAHKCSGALERIQLNRPRPADHNAKPDAPGKRRAPVSLCEPAKAVPPRKRATPGYI